MRVAPVDRDEDGLEPVSQFFQSSSPGRTSPKSGKKQQPRSAARVPSSLRKQVVRDESEEAEPLPMDGDYGGGGSDYERDEEEATQDMDVDDGTRSFSPFCAVADEVAQAPPSLLRASSDASTTHPPPVPSAESPPRPPPTRPSTPRALPSSLPPPKPTAETVAPLLPIRTTMTSPRACARSSCPKVARVLV